MEPQDTSMTFKLTLVLGLFTLGSGQWQVVGPHKAVMVKVGEDAVFSCSLSPETNAEAMEVRFFRNLFSNVVHLYRDGEDQEYMQMLEYRGRTELVKDSIVDGQVFMRLHHVVLSDAGLYGCWFSSGDYHQEALWELQVSVLGSTPVVSITGYVDGGIKLLCKSTGWFPEPTVTWKDPQGRDIPSNSTVNNDLKGLFKVETSFIVPKDFGNISCCIQFPNQGQVLESRVQIRETLYQYSPWFLPTTLLGTLLFFQCIGIIGVTIFFTKYRNLWEELEWREAKKYAVDLTLDPDTAHPQIYISDEKAVSFKYTYQIVPTLEKRFQHRCVAASQGFHEGKHYWEVDVGYKKKWGLGVCQENVNERFIDGVWELYNESENYFTYPPSQIYLRVKIPPTRIGIFLDCEGGTLSFFNINDQSLICTLSHQYKGLLRPYIWHHPYENSVTPIVICPMSWESEEEVISQRVPASQDTDNPEPLAQVTTPFLHDINDQRDHITSLRTIDFSLTQALQCPAAKEDFI